MSFFINSFIDFICGIYKFIYIINHDVLQFRISFFQLMFCTCLDLDRGVAEVSIMADGKVTPNVLTLLFFLTLEEVLAGEAVRPLLLGHGHQARTNRPIRSANERAATSLTSLMKGHMQHVGQSLHDTSSILDVVSPNSFDISSSLSCW